MEQPNNPRVTDKASWMAAIMEHRRALFERLVAEFSAELGDKVVLVDLWRMRLGGKARGKL